MKNLLEKEVYTEIKERLALLSPKTRPLWGKMNVGQMLHHCQKPFEIALQKEDFGLKPNFLINLLFKKSLYNDKPWRKNLPTAKPLIVKEEHDFTTEKEKLKSLISEFHDQKDKTDWPAHPSFGKFTPEQWGKMQYKHIDHHLTQFGV